MGLVGSMFLVDSFPSGACASTAPTCPSSALYVGCKSCAAIEGSKGPDSVAHCLSCEPSYNFVDHGSSDCTGACIQNVTEAIAGQQTMVLPLPRFFIGFTLITVAFPFGRTSVMGCFSKIMGPAPQGFCVGIMLAVGAVPRIIGPWWALVALEIACKIEEIRVLAWRQDLARVFNRCRRLCLLYANCNFIETACNHGARQR